MSETLIHFEHWADIPATIRSDGDHLQSGIDTTNLRMVWLNEDATSVYYTASGWKTACSDGTVTYLDEWFNDVNAKGNVMVAGGVYHDGDLDTSVVFTDDNVTVSAGGVSMIECSEGAQDAVNINPSSVDVDFVVNASGVSNALVVQGSDGFVGVGIATPAEKLGVYGTGTVRVEIESATDTGAAQLVLTNDGADANGTGLIGIGGSANATTNITDRLYVYGRNADGISIIGGATAKAVRFFTAINDTVSAACIDSNAKFLLNISTARANFINSTYSPLLQIEGTTIGTTSLDVVRNSNDNGGPYIFLGKTRGTTTGATTIVQSGDALGIISFEGIDGTQFVPGAEIKAGVSTTPGADDMPGYLAFCTTADGASTTTEAMRITHQQYLGVGTTTPASILELQSGLTTVGAILTLGTKETTVVVNDVLGRINFYAPLEADGTDAILVGASIAAIAEDTFAADNNKTSLVFQTGASETATTKMLLTSAGYLGIGVVDPDTKLEVLYAGTQLKLSFDGTDNMTVGVDTNGRAIFTPSGTAIYFANASVSQPMTDYAPATTFGSFSTVVSSGGDGGLAITGLTEGDLTALQLNGYVGHGHITYEAIRIVGAIQSGTGITDVTATDDLLTVYNHDAKIFEIFGNGDITMKANADLVTSFIGIGATPAASVRLYVESTTTSQVQFAYDSTHYTQFGIQSTGEPWITASNDKANFMSNAAGTTGFELIISQNSASPAANDAIGTLSFNGKNDAAEWYKYASIVCNIKNVGDGAEDATLTLSTPSTAIALTDGTDVDITGCCDASAGFKNNGTAGLSGTLTLDDGANWRITLTFAGGILTGETIGATSSATATWA